MMIIFSLHHQTVTVLPIKIAIRRLARSAFSSLSQDLSESNLFEDHSVSTLSKTKNDSENK
jgi:hypothetical protein